MPLSLWVSSASITAFTDDSATDACSRISDRLTEIIRLGVNDDAMAQNGVAGAAGRDTVQSKLQMSFPGAIRLQVSHIV
jgi:hypothetical protein